MYAWICTRDKHTAQDASAPKDYTCKIQHPQRPQQLHRQQQQHTQQPQQQVHLHRGRIRVQHHNVLHGVVMVGVQQLPNELLDGGVLYTSEAAQHMTEEGWEDKRSVFPLFFRVPTHPLTHSPTGPTLFNPTDVPKPSHPPPPSPQPHRMLCTVMPWTATEPIPSIIVPPHTPRCVCYPSGTDSLLHPRTLT